MSRLALLVALAVAASFPAVATARGYRSHASSATPSHRSRPATGGKATHASGSRRAFGVQRDAHGKIKRDPRQRAKFVRTHPCPSTGKTSGPCPGYVVDHVRALKHGGRDDPSNMQWQTVEAAKAKDRWE